VVGVVAVLALVGALAGLLLVERGGKRSVQVTVEGRAVQLPEGTTLGRAASMLSLRPQAGDILDVEGKVLRRGAVAGRILLDGRTAPPGTRLRSGDAVVLVAGRNQREPVSRALVRVPGGVPGDPQFFLARTPGSELIVRGSISHKLLSVRFRPSGPVRVERAVALTFDDGPSPVYTPRILATLRRLHAPATFFVIGYLADEYPDLVRAEQRAGMAIGNHSYNHPEVPPFDQLPRRLADDEITLGADSLARAGVKTSLFRPPGGSFSTALVVGAETLGERIVLWSVDPQDWQPDATARQIARRVLAAIRPGSIVELHDGGGDRSATLQALSAIVNGIRHKHLRLVPIRSR
jgi:peptidoglycan/xylan/chitin deacetylase (PgdA/CDA1 family)